MRGWQVRVLYGPQNVIALLRKQWGFTFCEIVQDEKAGDREADRRSWSRRGREYFVFYKCNEIKYLVTRDRVLKKNKKKFVLRFLHIKTKKQDPVARWRAGSLNTAELNKLLIAGLSAHCVPRGSTVTLLLQRLPPFEDGVHEIGETEHAITSLYLEE